MTIHVDIPALKQPEQYRRLARQAIRNAEQAPSAYFRLGFLSLASGWRALAEQAEKKFWESTHEQVHWDDPPPERRAT
ncbi:MAG: hypothetical protein JO208_00645 [Alphaproteobacteria bacterium]|nr:hypothetical protein [Alphaproteobacteria bacterium]